MGLKLNSFKKIVVIAIGGNSLITDNKKSSSFEEQFATVRLTCKNIARLVKLGYKVVITHGNGPQIGDILIRSYLTRKQLPEIPLDIAGAITQGFIGYMIQHSIKNELLKLNLKKDVVTVITQVLVSKDDPAFKRPTKPIGPFYSKKEATQLQKELDWIMKEDAGRGYRRMVSSPTPIKIIEANQIKTLLENETIVIACGGGGIPVIYNDKGKLTPVPAVIDKDLSSQLLASEIDADIFIISTSVAYVYLNYNKPNQKALTNLKLSELIRYYENNEFAEGSMKPKIKAVIKFLQENPNHRLAIITNPENIVKALKNKYIGTKITK
jgi:carbamate kinase